ncbi:MAG: O-acetyl-ADP-ribose deacetylase [Rhodanobacteraceae bacterium]
MPQIEILETDITQLQVDAIVNAAQPSLLGGGGVDGAIHAAAGPELLAACLKLPESEPGVRCPTGQVRITPGFELPALHVIHTVGPVWHGGTHGEAELLASCYRNALRLAAARHLDSIAFPAISCGVYGYPLAAAARIAVDTIRLHASEQRLPERIVLCAHGAGVSRALRQAVSTS